MDATFSYLIRFLRNCVNVLRATHDLVIALAAVIFLILVIVKLIAGGH
jgi:hypothetical protein